jgi:hypothetical protein
LAYEIFYMIIIHLIQKNEKKIKVIYKHSNWSIAQTKILRGLLLAFSLSLINFKLFFYLVHFHYMLMFRFLHAIVDNKGKFIASQADLKR